MARQAGGLAADLGEGHQDLQAHVAVGVVDGAGLADGRGRGGGAGHGHQHVAAHAPGGVGEQAGRMGSQRGRIGGELAQAVQGPQGVDDAGVVADGVHRAVGLQDAFQQGAELGRTSPFR